MVSVDLFKDTSIFKGFSDAELENIAKLCSEKSFKNEDIIFSTDDESRELFILIEGACAVKIKTSGAAEHFTVYMMEPGEVFGEIGFLTGKPRIATIIATRDSKIVVMDKADFVELIAEEDSIGRKIMTNLALIFAERLRQTDLEFRNFYLKSSVSFGRMFSE